MESEAKTVVYDGTISTLSPLAHNSDESLGVDTKFRRIQTIHDSKAIKVPVYSGNAFRGILRRLAAKQFCDLLDLGKESISDRLYYTFFTGGALQKGSSQDYIEVGKKREMREKIPFLSLFGTALQNQIIAGKLEIGLGIPCAKETEHMTGTPSELTIWEFLDEVFYVRKDDREDKQDEKKKDDAAQQMKYTIEVLIPGVVMQHRIVANYCSPVELACLGHAMQAMTASGILGGKSGTGHGRVKYDYAPEFENPKPYLDYVTKNKESILEYIRGMEGKI